MQLKADITDKAQIFTYEGFITKLVLKTKKETSNNLAMQQRAANRLW